MNASSLAVARSRLSRRGLAGLLAAAGLAAAPDPGLATPKAEAKRCRRKRTACSGKNWCMDRTQTCGSAGGIGKCLLRPFGASMCAEILFQAQSCADCAAPNCTDCACALAAGGGDRCNNGTTGYDYICVREIPLPFL
jgi:hypothetical protein